LGGRNFAHQFSETTTVTDREWVSEEVSYQEPHFSVEGSWTDVFRYDGAIHLPILLSIVIGVFQGYLKDRFGGAIIYALADGAYLLAILAWLGSMAIRRASLSGPGGMVPLILAMLVIPSVYVFHPGTTFLVSLAGLRSWTLFPVAFLIAVTTIRTRGQVYAYMHLIIFLCAISGAYGVNQYFQGPDIVASVSDLSALRHGTTNIFALESGETGFRAYSTFTFPAPFAGMMVFGILLAGGLVSRTRAGRLEKLYLIILIPLMFWGMTVSGTRASLIILALGVVINLYYRGWGLRIIFLVPFGFLALHFLTVISSWGGTLTRRFASTALTEGILWTYLSAPVVTALDYLASNPLGIGLGRTGVGVPFIITSKLPRDYFVFSDGDIGRASVEMGVFGILSLGIVIFLIVRFLPMGLRVVLPSDSSRYVGLAIGPLILSTALAILIGSPLSSIPHGLIWWFLFGALIKLAMIEAEESSPPPGDEYADDH
jgi:hypothetical protein